MKAWHVILILVLLILSFLGGRYTKRCEPCYVRDTVIRYDTIISEIPDPQIEVVIDTIEIPYVIYLRDTVSGDTIRDTTTIYLPRQSRTYQTDLYRVIISGYDPTLDSIAVYNRTEIIYKYKEAKRWGFGVIGGYGVGNDGFSPYIGIGVYYRLF